MKPLEYTVGQLRALAAFAGADDTRLHLTQVRWTAEYVAATNGHRMVRVTAPVDVERSFGIGAEDIRRVFAGFKPSTRVRITDVVKVKDRGAKSFVSLEVLRPTADRKRPVANDAEIYLVLDGDYGGFPPIEQVMPKCMVDGWVAPEVRVLKPHSLDARYLEGLGELCEAFDIGGGSSRGMQLLDAPGDLEPICYGGFSNYDHTTVTVIIMPLRGDVETIPEPRKTKER